MKNICPKCLDQTNIIGNGETGDGRTYTIYYCTTCQKSHDVFDVPVTEHEVVLVALVGDALSDNEPLQVAAAEERVEQLLMFPSMRMWDW